MKNQSEEPDTLQSETMMFFRSCKPEFSSLGNAEQVRQVSAEVERRGWKNLNLTEVVRSTTTQFLASTLEPKEVDKIVQSCRRGIAAYTAVMSHAMGVKEIDPQIGEVGNLLDLCESAKDVQDTVATLTKDATQKVTDVEEKLRQSKEDIRVLNGIIDAGNAQKHELQTKLQQTAAALVEARQETSQVIQKAEALQKAVSDSKAHAPAGITVGELRTMLFEHTDMETDKLLKLLQKHMEVAQERAKEVDNLAKMFKAIVTTPGIAPIIEANPVLKHYAEMYVHELNCVI